MSPSQDRVIPLSGPVCPSCRYVIHEVGNRNRWLLRYCTNCEWFEYPLRVVEGGRLKVVENALQK